jgi:hypothetical protein
MRQVELRHRRKSSLKTAADGYTGPYVSMISLDVVPAAGCCHFDSGVDDSTVTETVLNGKATKIAAQRLRRRMQMPYRAATARERCLQSHFQQAPNGGRFWSNRPTQDGAAVGLAVLDRLRAEMLYRVGLSDVLSV